MPNKNSKKSTKRTSQNKNVKTKNGKVVVIDPGHGGCR